MAPVLTPRTDIADALAAPVFVEALAAAIVRYGSLTREPEADTPLEVFDLAPASGILAARLLRALHRQREDAGARWPVRLHVCADTAATGGLSPTLEQALARGEAQWWRGDLSSAALRDGAVVLALGYFQQLPVRIGAAHYAQWLEACIERQPRDAEGGWPLAYHWAAAGEGAPEDPALRALRELYTDKLGSIALNLPIAGLDAVRHLANATGESYLLLAADAGAADLRDIQTGALTPPTLWREGCSTMPVNFHALACAQPHARIAHCRTGSGPLLQVALAGAASAAQFERVVAPVRTGAEHALQLREQVAWIAPEAPAPLWLSHLRQCAFDPHVVASQPLGLASAPLEAVAREAWRDALEHAWVLARDEPSAGASIAVGMRATHLGLWGLARRVLHPWARDLPPAAAECLALAELHTGDAVVAAARWEAEASRAPDDWRAHLLAYRDGCTRLNWYHPASAGDGGLCLEPLDIHHAPAWLEQYRDPHIGVMTRLPELLTLEEVQAWIAEQRADPSRACFAVVDREHGFVGSACYQRAGDSGYFHFWIGADHQNRGLGRRAGRLLQGQAREAGVRCLYTSAYQENPRSRAALAALDFVGLAVRASPPDEDLLFFAHALVPGARPGPRGLRNLCRAVDSPMAFADETAAA